MAALAALVTLPLTRSPSLTQDDINLVDESISNLLLEALSTGAPPAPRPVARPHRKTAWRLPLDFTHPLLAPSPPTVTPPSPHRHPSPYPRPPQVGSTSSARASLCATPSGKRRDALTILRMHVLHTHTHTTPSHDPPPRRM